MSDLSEAIASATPSEYLNEEDRAQVREARDDLRDTHLPAPTGQVGCLAAMLAVVAAAITLRLANNVPGFVFIAPFVILGALLTVIGSIVWGMSGGSGGRNAASAAIESALSYLEDEGSDRSVCLRAATVLLMRATIDEGPATHSMYEPGELVVRLGSRLPLVVAVEELLMDKHGIRPVFTFPLPEPDH
ncbi:MAG: hypothetical protein OSA81_00005 [Longimicrobiales bacterium]|uniref:Uncharacterized protein n=1 Tax=uncultured marine bacterium Ant4D5 TaxID=360428 RepID=Q2PY08_9BACT|nr:hypothetical protein [uncultured marine bacterium Ant4D5]MDE0897372.1 hypothetical protein [Longimicrobiales bacterium]